jgi:hypothetical protein
VTIIDGMATRATTWWAYAAGLSATVGFVPLHLIWALGFPLWADPDLFRTWYDTGGAGYLFALNALALLPAVLALALVRPWGLRFPRMLLIVPGTVVSVFLFAYTAFAAAIVPSQWNSEGAIFEPWIALYGIPQFLIWATGLAVATRSYALRTRPPECRAVGAP